MCARIQLETKVYQGPDLREQPIETSLIFIPNFHFCNLKFSELLIDIPISYYIKIASIKIPTIIGKKAFNLEV